MCIEIRSAIFASMIALSLSNCMQKDSPAITQPELASRSVKIIEVDGYKFKDLNKSGELDIYEDWRLSPEERSKDLVSKMSVQEKVGFMLISTTRMKNDRAFEGHPPKSRSPVTLMRKTWFRQPTYLQGNPCPIR